MGKGDKKRIESLKQRISSIEENIEWFEEDYSKTNDAETLRSIDRFKKELKETKKAILNFMPGPENKDNKGVTVGRQIRHGIHWNSETTRYPSNKRSKRQWKMFYATMLNVDPKELIYVGLNNGHPHFVKKIIKSKTGQTFVYDIDEQKYVIKK